VNPLFKLTKYRLCLFQQLIFPKLAGVVAVASWLGLSSALSAGGPVELVRDGHAVAVRSVLAVQLPGDAWKTSIVGPDKVSVFQGAGQGARLVAGVNVPAGDFEIRARLRMLDQEKSAAGFFFNGSFFGFEGANANEVFLNGPAFGGGLKSLGASKQYFERGSWIDFVVQRHDKSLSFMINGKKLIAIGSSGRFENWGFSPWRSTMQITSLSISADKLVKAPVPKSRGYSIPTIDLAGQTFRQTIVDREKGQYLGHPTTVLLEDNKTIIAVYPKGHGRGAIVMKKSSDAGKTWSPRLEVPESWATSKEVPTIFPTVDKQGKQRLIMFSGLYPIRMAYSEDNGVQWSQLEPIGDYGGIVAMGCLIRMNNGDYVALFHDDGRFIKGSGKSDKFFVYSVRSSDGGMTWSDPTVIATHDIAHLCEPGFTRSPDGKKIVVFLRENSRRLNSFMIESTDEGETWSQPQELPASLTGDRHIAKYTADGRLFITFRDTTHASPTKGDWVAWVGTFDDIMSGREGQYRVRLMDNTKGGDCAYPGLELLPDDTLVTTTYGHWTKGETAYVVTVHLKLSELDEHVKAWALK
jgi:hypothetical protein|tara:strand:+ start:2472 stop:4211 length:1740 start_codon:yes stop_codon:yes gene_type:complete